MPSIEDGALIAGRFEVLRPLGAGGLAEVYAARDRVTGAEMAIKVLHEHLAHDEKLAERFRREMVAARSLDHKNIVRIFDLHAHRSEDGRVRPLLAMELLSGRTLADRIDEGPLPHEEALSIARAITEALQAAHNAGVVHRDLKPQNVMLCEDGTVKLLDFGLARAAGWVRLTAQSTMLGTPSYMAPELFNGEGGDARADLYALGATLFEMLTGKTAFRSADPLEIIRAKGMPPPSMRTLLPAVRSEDDALVRRAMDPDPERRMLDAGQLLGALSGRPAAASSVEPAPRMAAGTVDVVFHQAPLGTSKPLLAVIDAAGGARPKLPFRLSLRLTGTAILASGVDRETAQALARLSDSKGVPAAIRPIEKPGRFRALLAKLAVPLGVVAGGFFGFNVTMLMKSLLEEAQKDATHAPPLLAIALCGVLAAITPIAAGFFCWSLLRRDKAALAAPRPGDANTWRLFEGIHRRVRAVRELADRSGSPLAAELADTAASLGREAEGLAQAAAQVRDPLTAEDPDLVELVAGQLEARDAALARLLQIAASLDAALAEATDPTAPAERLDSILRSLRVEAGFVKAALREVRLAREATGISIELTAKGAQLAAMVGPPPIDQVDTAPPRSRGHEVTPTP